MKQKDVTTSSASVSIERGRRRGHRREINQDDIQDWNNTRLLGLSTGELLETILQQSDGPLPAEQALDELESRLGWDAAAKALSGYGPAGDLLARKRWGAWLQPKEPRNLQLEASPATFQSATPSPSTKTKGHGPDISPRQVLSAAKEPLPHRSALQAAFGHHDLSETRASIGGAASKTSTKLGALAFAAGERMAFKRRPDLRLTAHEATHVIQQRAGLRGAGAEAWQGDRLEHEADLVADEVAGGKRVEALLDKLYPNALGAKAPDNASLQLFKAQIVLAQEEEEEEEEEGRDIDEESIEHSEVSLDAEHDDIDFDEEHDDLDSLASDDEVEDNEPTYVIRDIIMSGRTPSPFSKTMGAHSTAWTAHTDAVRRQLQDLRIGPAIDAMHALVDAALTSPALQLTDNISPERRKSLNAAMTNVQALRDEGPDDSVSLHAWVTWIQDYIHDYLDFVNQMPLGTVESGSTDGNAEGVARQALMPIEHGEDPPGADIIRGHLAALFAGDTPAAFIRDSAVEAQGANANDAWAVGMHTFLRTLREAYPTSYNAAGLDDGATLTQFLRAIGMPDSAFQTLRDIGGGAVAANDFGQANPPAYSGGAQAVELRVGDDLNVADLQVEGRPDSPFTSTMGAHSTAWIAHIDGLRALVLGLELNAAIAAIAARVDEALSSPSLGLLEFVLPDQVMLIARTSETLRYFHGKVRLPGPTTERISLTQQYIAAFLAFLNALPLTTVEAADTTGHAEGHHAGVLRAYENKGFAKGCRRDDVIKSFWGLLDLNAAKSMLDNLIPAPIPELPSGMTNSGRPRRGATMRGQADNQRRVQEENANKVSAREQAFREKPIDDEDQDRVKDLHSGADKLPETDSNLIYALALREFLSTMERAYPDSYALAWGDLSGSQRAREISARDLDGEGIIESLDALPEVELSGPKSISYSSSKTGKFGLDPKEREDALRRAEQRNAQRDGIAGAYNVGHASGRRNACLTYSLLRHANGVDPTNAEVDQIMANLAAHHPDIAANRDINLFSNTGHAIIQEVQAVTAVQLNVWVVTTLEAGEVPIHNGGGEAVDAGLYLMPGHFVPIWRPAIGGAGGGMAPDIEDDDDDIASMN